MLLCPTWDARWACGAQGPSAPSNCRRRSGRCPPLGVHPPALTCEAVALPGVRVLSAWVTRATAGNALPRLGSPGQRGARPGHRGRARPFPPRAALGPRGTPSPPRRPMQGPGRTRLNSWAPRLRGGCSAPGGYRPPRSLSLWAPPAPAAARQGLKGLLQSCRDKALEATGQASRGLLGSFGNLRATVLGPASILSPQMCKPESLLQPEVKLAPIKP